MNTGKIANRVRIVLVCMLFVPAILFSFFLLNKIIHYPLWIIAVLSLLALFGFWLNIKLSEYTKK